ncbi:hypothetical protein ColLi_05200 [Colletotrichum liriopes]|uniref:Uncharacterized protein n=1 Tax=Colletotrichum liriopes TaxID=708192 RepID=A0AA37LS43_9PEZI|nr:hypothetical protein ColLi_05200 [Colletotrichum liriopes]
MTSPVLAFLVRDSINMAMRSGRAMISGWLITGRSRGSCGTPWGSNQVLVSMRSSGIYGITLVDLRSMQVVFFSHNWATKWGVQAVLQIVTSALRVLHHATGKA